MEIGDVEDCKMRATTQECIIDSKFNKFKQGGISSYITGVANMVPNDGDASALGVSLVEPDLTHYSRMSNILASIKLGVAGVNDPECVGTINTLT